MALIDLQRGVVELCFGPEPTPEELARIGDARIWRVYRDAIRKRLRAELKVALPRTHAAAGDRFQRAFERFLASEPPRVRFFHAVPGCFAAVAAPWFAADPGAPAYLPDLCRYEAALWEVSDLPDSVPASMVEFSFESVPVLAPALRLLDVGHAVHSEPSPEGGYVAGQVFLCIHRKPEERKARTWILNAVTYDLMQRFASSGDTVAQAVQWLVRERGLAIDEQFLDGLCTVLADFLERGLILGGR